MEQKQLPTFRGRYRGLKPDFIDYCNNKFGNGDNNKFGNGDNSSSSVDQVAKKSSD